MKFEVAPIHFLSDVFVPIVVVVAKFPNMYKVQLDCKPVRCTILAKQVCCHI